MSRPGKDEKMLIGIDQACPYCGQFIAIKIGENMTEQEREEIAGKKCGCPQAARARGIAEALDKLEQVCGETSLNNGFDSAVDDEVMDICRKNVEWVYDLAIAEATIRTRQGDRIVIRCSAKDDVKIKRTCQKQMQL